MSRVSIDGEAATRDPPPRVIMTARSTSMGDKGGKKDKAKSKQRHDVKQKAEVKGN